MADSDDGFNPYGSGPDPIGPKPVALSYEEGMELSRSRPGEKVEWTMKTAWGEMPITSVTIPRSAVKEGWFLPDGELLYRHDVPSGLIEMDWQTEPRKLYAASLAEAIDLHERYPLDDVYLRVPVEATFTERLYGTSGK